LDCWRCQRYFYVVHRWLVSEHLVRAFTVKFLHVCVFGRLVFHILLLCYRVPGRECPILNDRNLLCRTAISSFEHVIHTSTLLYLMLVLSYPILFYDRSFLTTFQPRSWYSKGLLFFGILFKNVQISGNRLIQTCPTHCIWWYLTYDGFWESAILDLRSFLFTTCVSRCEGLIAPATLIRIFLLNTRHFFSLTFDFSY